MRQFKLINADGFEFDLMSKQSLFIEPNGFGIGTDTQIQRIGANFVVINSEELQPAPSGIIAFSNYDSFEKFRAFVRKGGIVLCYKPINVWYFLDCTVKVDKSEIEKESQMLNCPVEFTGISSWHEKPKEFRSKTDSKIGKIYPFTYSYSYATTLAGVIDIENGELPSACKIHILGPCKNPSFFISQSGNRIATGKINCTIIEERKLVINSDPSNMEIAEYTINGEFVVDKYADSDFTTQRLVEVPPGISRFAFTQDGVGDVNAWVEVSKRV